MRFPPTSRIGDLLIDFLLPKKYLVLGKYAKAVSAKFPVVCIGKFGRTSSGVVRPDSQPKHRRVPSDRTVDRRWRRLSVASVKGRPTEDTVLWRCGYHVRST
jgi:hypothetical protein